MSDLISRSALMESLIHCDGLGRKSLEAVVKTINEQPTVEAIPKEKLDEIVERLEKLKREEVLCDGCPFFTEIDCYIHCDEYKLMKTIEIVKGVMNE